MSKALKYRWTDAIFSDTGPRSSVILVLVVLADFMDPDGSNCHPGVRAIVKKTKLSHPTVVKALGEARRDGWVTVERLTGGRRGGIYHRYRPRFPRGWKEQEEGGPESKESGKATEPVRSKESGKPTLPVQTAESGKATEPLPESEVVNFEKQSGKIAEVSGKIERAEVVKSLNLTYPIDPHRPTQLGTQIAGAHAATPAHTDAPAHEAHTPEIPKIAANDLVAAWIDQQDAKPDQAEIRKQGAVAKRICTNHELPDIVRAFIGIGFLFPYDKGEPWDLFDLERKFSKAKQAILKDPDIKMMKRAEEIRDQLLGGDL